MSPCASIAALPLLMDRASQVWADSLFWTLESQQALLQWWGAVRERTSKETDAEWLSCVGTCLTADGGPVQLIPGSTLLLPLSLGKAQAVLESS